MKQMVYQENRIIDLLDSGTYCGYNYYILNLGTHPTAYIEIPNTHKFYKMSYWDINLSVHSGLTYASDKLRISEKKILKGWFIGWDYAHSGDYTGFEEILKKHVPSYFIEDDNKKWTTEEIQKEVYEACKELERVDYEI